MSDLEKWKSYLKFMNIDFDLSDDNIITISEDHLDSTNETFGKVLQIIFNKNGKFINFSPWGEMNI